VQAALTPAELESLNVNLLESLYSQATSDPTLAHVFIGGPHLFAVIVDSCIDAALGTDRAAEIGGKIVQAVVASVDEAKRNEAIRTVAPIFRCFRRHRVQF
jgi:hypothetical protein